MLVLTRKRAEVIRIGENVTVKVIRTGKNTVKIGIEAPADIRVLRGELAHRSPPPPRVSQDVVGGSEPEAFALNCSDQFPHVI